MATSDATMSTKRLTIRCHGRSWVAADRHERQSTERAHAPVEVEDLEEPGDDVDRDPGRLAAAQEGKDLGIAAARERDDDSVDALLHQNAVEVVDPADHGRGVLAERRRIVVEAPDHLRRTLHAAACEADVAAGHDPGAQHQHALTPVPGLPGCGGSPATDECRGLRRSGCRLDVRLELRRQEKPSAWRSGWAPTSSRFARIANWPSVLFSPRGGPPGRRVATRTYRRAVTASRG